MYNIKEKYERAAGGGGAWTNRRVMEVKIRVRFVTNPENGKQLSVSTFVWNKLNRLLKADEDICIYIYIYLYKASGNNLFEIIVKKWTGRPL